VNAYTELLARCQVQANYRQLVAPSQPERIRLWTVWQRREELIRGFEKDLAKCLKAGLSDRDAKRHSKLIREVKAALDLGRDGKFAKADVAWDKLLADNPANIKEKTKSKLSRHRSPE
jgi:hypothetical protein